MLYYIKAYKRKQKLVTYKTAIKMDVWEHGINRGRTGADKSSMDGATRSYLSVLNDKTRKDDSSQRG